MNPLYRYFRDIYLGVVTTCIGMKVTLTHIFMPTITVQYPKEKLTYPPRARTMLVTDMETCNGCLQCSRACPVEIIHIETVKALPEDNLGNAPDGKPRRLHVLLFDVEMDKCVHCGLCTEVCPTESIHWENQHEEVSFTRDGMMRHWAEYSVEDRERLKKRAEEIKAEKAKAAAAAQAAKEAKAKKEGDAPPKKADKEGEPQIKSTPTEKPAAKADTADEKGFEPGTPEAKPDKAPPADDSPKNDEESK
ncbi:NADPH-quinone oxidoreductase [candidate division LCP-89 bacterium B3_LCP]|uniref:NADPH-quinone oxidoreductase n=1 Tax=candidate division LCP-89 bacterium B3_LCP TaxID=2012998 RepID=A0A532V6I1_UNCL8|nr:MAG: NADPH-quinone oxidoreductase [candidate division LCP-89 bacterium B3_LCP]